jgi:ATP-binding cassette, subfamily C, bacterial CydC
MTRHPRDLAPVLKLFAAHNRGKLLAGAALSAATVLAGIALLGLSGWFITATAIAGLSLTTALAFDVFAPSAGIRFLALARTGARYGERLTTHDATLGVLAELRERLFRGWAKPGDARNLLMRPSKLLFRLTLDIDALDSLYLRVLVPAGAALAATIAAGVALGLMHPLAGLGAASFLLLAGFGIPVRAAHAARGPARRRAHAIEVLRSRAIDLVQGQTELLMAGRLHAQCVALAAADSRLAKADEALNRIEARVVFGFGVVSAVLLGATVFAMVILAERGAIGAPAAALGVLIALAAFEPFSALRRGAVELGRTLLASQRIAPRLAPEAATPHGATLPAGIAACLDRVTAQHPGASCPVLHDLSLSVRDGERVALIGASGVGKSTLLALLAGELTPASGRVKARSATLLTQRTELFQDSLRDNLRLAAPDADDARLLDALHAAGLRADVEALPIGLDTRLGEGGLGLSGGQARRLTLARLLLRDTPLWLLDEPTDGLDAATARDVLARLDVCAAGRTIIIATHIRREAERADRLLIIDHGRIAVTAERGEPTFDAALAALRPD